LVKELMRLQRALARAGVASRRAAEDLITAGRVRVNGAVATLGQSVTPGKDKITLDGKAIAAPAATAEWYLLHKPAGTLTSKSDPNGRPTVFGLVPKTPGLTYVGRLDYMTEGALLFTTDGTMAHRLTHPSFEVERAYEAIVRGDASHVAKTLRKGLVLEDGLVHASEVQVEFVGKGHWSVGLTLTEGRNREVRRVCEAMGLEVTRLVRTRFGPIKLGRLPLGECRPLSRNEIALLNAL
jgi:23S rRNA pseudouridine2605 synthase